MTTCAVRSKASIQPKPFYNFYCMNFKHNLKMYGLFGAII